MVDNSVSMSGYKEERAKEDAIEFIDDLLESQENRVSLVTFNEIFGVRYPFTSEKEAVKSTIKNLMFNHRSSFYQGLKGIEEVLKEYERKDDRDCMVLFLTGSYPSLDTPNEVGYFNYLKEEYPYLTINAIQYGMGAEIISPVKKISDTQYYVDETVEENMLFKASISTVEYDQFEV